MTRASDDEGSGQRGQRLSTGGLRREPFVDPVSPVAGRQCLVGQCVRVGAQLRNPNAPHRCDLVRLRIRRLLEFAQNGVGETEMMSGRHRQYRCPRCASRPGGWVPMTLPSGTATSSRTTRSVRLPPRALRFRGGSARVRSSTGTNAVTTVRVDGSTAATVSTEFSPPAADPGHGAGEGPSAGSSCRGDEMVRKPADVADRGAEQHPAL